MYTSTPEKRIKTHPKRVQVNKENTCTCIYISPCENRMPLYYVCAKFKGLIVFSYICMVIDRWNVENLNLPKGTYLHVHVHGTVNFTFIRILVHMPWKLSMRHFKKTVTSSIFVACTHSNKSKKTSQAQFSWHAQYAYVYSNKKCSNSPIFPNHLALIVVVCSPSIGHLKGVSLLNVHLFGSVAARVPLCVTTTLQLLLLPGDIMKYCPAS